jgi:meiotically up-regulated gene 157 (Mug157) protein
MSVYKELFPKDLDGPCQPGDARTSTSQIRAICALADEVRAIRLMLEPLVKEALDAIEKDKKS